jgi:hypothetical protein
LFIPFVTTRRRLTGNGPRCRLFRHGRCGETVPGTAPQPLEAM